MNLKSSIFNELLNYTNLVNFLCCSFLFESSLKSRKTTVKWFLKVRRTIVYKANLIFVKGENEKKGMKKRKKKERE